MHTYICIGGAVNFERLGLQLLMTSFTTNWFRKTEGDLFF